MIIVGILNVIKYCGLGIVCYLMYEVNVERTILPPSTNYFIATIYICMYPGKILDTSVVATSISVRRE
jgi:hypothetical protein